MSRHGTLLAIPADPSFQLLIDAWPAMAEAGLLRSRWLREFEDELRLWYPFASNADLRLSARHVAPFFLKDGPNVP